MTKRSPFNVQFWWLIHEKDDRFSFYFQALYLNAVPLISLVASFTKKLDRIWEQAYREDQHI